jgi:hypothetical protein
MKAQEIYMQEILPIAAVAQPWQYPDLKVMVRGIKWILVGIWRPIRWLLEVIFTPPPGQEYIEESRNKVIRLIGHY